MGPKYLIGDNDGTFGVGLDRVARTSRIEILTTPYHAPRANAICERFLDSVRRECLDHLLILHERQLQSSSKHQITEEVNSQCARRISHVASTALMLLAQPTGTLLLLVHFPHTRLLAT